MVPARSPRNRTERNDSRLPFSRGNTSVRSACTDHRGLPAYRDSSVASSIWMLTSGSRGRVAARDGSYRCANLKSAMRPPNTASVMVGAMTLRMVATFEHGPARCIVLNARLIHWLSKRYWRRARHGRSRRAVQHDVEQRGEEQGKQRAEAEAANHRDGERLLHLRAGAYAEGQRKQA